uniref:Tyrosine-protein phosphatase domain-containing protein n=1 Tax=Noctiluca scintillans TaxID=2966 RepID=A0A7S1AMV4_NOCSC|mmetsp:Transcript_5268/g.14968  ORF Transcript_5268/g.14968 Transcript_5268/m.14968 type:complete len:535 (+) Transcript_5268:82-1686(+)
MTSTSIGSYEILGAVKVKDGLFVGDELSAQDLEFVVANKVTRVVNCCGRQVPNHWEPIGVVYLCYTWLDADDQVILDPRDSVANETFRFIDEALEGAESVLIHSVRGQSRSCCVLAAYMMKRYNWGLRKTMEFLSSRRPDLNLKPTFLQQLSGYERRLMAQSKVPFSLDWTHADFGKLECEELLLRNTYLNSQMGPLADFGSDIMGKPRRLLWADNHADDRSRLEKPAGVDRFDKQRPILRRTRDVRDDPSTAARPKNPVQTAWAPPVGGGSACGSGTVPSHSSSVGSAAGSASDDSRPTGWCSPEVSGGDPASTTAYHPVLSSSMVRRGSVRDSLSRRDSPEPGSRPGSRDPSPKTAVRRESPVYRDPQRMSRPRPGASGPERRPGTSTPTYPLDNLGFGFGLRPPGSSNFAPNPGQGAGMGAFRSGGPVRAKPGVFANDSSVRRSRPAPVPSRRGSGSRPASPIGTSSRASSASRPASPLQQRPPSPSGKVIVQDPRLSAKHRSLSSHMRRAPSPTPAFNRNPSPSKPRWRM